MQLSNEKMSKQDSDFCACQFVILRLSLTRAWVAGLVGET